MYEANTSVVPKLLRKEQRDLDLQAEFFSGIIERDSGSHTLVAEARYLIAQNRVRRGQLEQAGSYFLEYSRLAPLDPRGFYDHACVLSKQGENLRSEDTAIQKLEMAALTSLRRAVDLEPPLGRRALRDNDLSFLRLRPALSAFWEHIKAINKKI